MRPSIRHIAPGGLPMPAQMFAFYDELVNIGYAGDQQKAQIGHVSISCLNADARTLRVSLLLRDESRARHGRVRAFKKACCCLRQTALSGLPGRSEQASQRRGRQRWCPYMP